jgi:hypothetical protein
MMMTLFCEIGILQGLTLCMFSFTLKLMKKVQEENQFLLKCFEQLYVGINISNNVLLAFNFYRDR